ncbi:MAG: class I tRNA ligase family protein, partial [Chitinophagaceae bacterium]
DSKNDNWKNNVYCQCKSWLDNGLQSRSMTRDGEWGIKVPLPNAEGKVLYVWFDAPIGYISATKELLPDDWETYWKSEDTRLIHFIGKDNIVFHCIIFPAMLKAHGGFVLADNVPANEFLNIESDKVSTSRNWAVWVHEYLKDFPGQQDALRYVLCANMPENKDNDFTWKDFQERNNNELVAILGNFVNRTMVLMHKLTNGKVPFFHPELSDERDKNIVEALTKNKKGIEDSLENFHFRDALSAVIDVAREGNKYMQERAPWLLSKTPEMQAQHQKEIDNCIHVCLQLTANLAIMTNPFLPFTAKKICHMLKVVDRMLEWENAGSMHLVRPGYSLRAPELLFPKVDDEQVKAQVEKLEAGAALRKAQNNSSKIEEDQQKKSPVSEDNEVVTGGHSHPLDSLITGLKSQFPEIKPEIEIDDFAKLDLRVGKVLAAEAVEKTDKLLKLTIDIGVEQRTVVSGIAKHYKPEEIIGKYVTLIANLKPRKMRGIE